MNYKKTDTNNLIKIFTQRGLTFPTSRQSKLRVATPSVSRSNRRSAAERKPVSLTCANVTGVPAPPLALAAYSRAVPNYESSATQCDVVDVACDLYVRNLTHSIYKIAE